MEKPKPRIGVGVVVLREGKVLLGKRKGAHGSGHWSFAGGHLEWGETVQSCAIRELAEETGLQATSVKLGPWTSDVMEGDKHYITLFAFVEECKGEPKLMEPDKCEGWRWFDLHDLPSPLFPPVQSLMNVMDKDTLLSKLLAFFQERDWEKFHSPKNLVMDLASEVGELVDPFRWLTEEESKNLDEKTRASVEDEIGDIFLVLQYLSHKLGINPEKSAHKKLEKIRKKYPADLSRGKNLKYTAYE